MKKIKITFWLLGFGCGITLAGIAGTWMTLQIDASIQQENQDKNKTNPKTDNIQLENQTSIENKNQQENLKNPIQNKEVLEEKEINNNQAVVDNKEELIGGDESKAVEESKEKIKDYYEVFIPNTSGASDICSILEAAGVIENGKEFHQYIKTQGKQAYLKDGTFKLPKNADYETLLALLLA